jgi:hypothetical protein
MAAASFVWSPEALGTSSFSVIICYLPTAKANKLATRGRRKMKTKNRRPPWWVGGSEAEKAPGSDFFPKILCGVFLLPSPRNAPKRDKRKPRKNRVLFFVAFFVKTFRHDFPQNVFCSVFELPLLRNTRKRDKTKKSGGTEIEIFVDFFGKSFRHGLFAKIL